MRTEAAVRLDNLRFRYGNGPEILSGVSLSVRKGETFGLLGRIGVGKTCILRLIAKLLNPTSGRIERSPEVERLSCGYVLQKDSLFPWLTVEENLQLVLPGRSPLADHPVVREWGVHPMLALKPAQLSGGMSKKVNLARGFLNSSPLILMDEPFGGLDPAQKIEMQRTAVDALDRDSASALVVTHDVQEALYLCHRIALFSAKTRSAPRLLENPFRGRALTRQLLAEPGYQELSEIAFQFYAGELL